MPEKVSIHSKKYYRVVLESIDPQRENAESFAIKLAMRTRTSLPRVRQVIRKLPKTIKKGLDVQRANKLKTVIEETGGIVRVESYFVTPGDEAAPEQSQTVTVTRSENAADVELRDMSLDPELDDCIESADWDQGETAEPPPPQSRRDEPSEPPKPAKPPKPPKPESPVDTPTVEPSAPSRARAVRKAIRDNLLLIAAGILMILLTIAIFKQ
jgi:outer membrane biosynthesis protein TonB